MNRVWIGRIVRAALVAALYTVFCLLLAPAAAAPVQVRVSEALTLLPVLFPEAVLGVTVGCFFSNMILSTPLDMIVGSLTTLAAALLTRKLRKVRFRGLAVWASIPPILLNALVMGTALTFMYYPAGTPFSVFLLNMATVGLGQLISCGVLGVLLVYGMEKNPMLQKISGAGT